MRGQALRAVAAGGPGMQTAVMQKILRYCNPALKEVVEASPAGDMHGAFE